MNSDDNRGLTPLGGTLQRLIVLGSLLFAPAIARAHDDADTEVAKRYFAEGRDLYAADQYQRALEAFEKANVAKPLPAFEFNIARCHDRLGRWPEALAAYERYSASNADPSDGKEAAERIPILRKRVKEAVDRAASDEHYRRAVDHFNANEFAAAVDQFKFAYAAVPDPMNLYNIAQCYRMSSDGAKAIDYFEQFIAHEPQSPLRNAVELRVTELKTHPNPKPSPGPTAPGRTPTAGSVALAQIAILPVGATPSAPRQDPPTTVAARKAADPPSIAPGSAPAPSSSERLAPIGEIIKANRPAFRACFDEWSRKHPNIAGKVTFSFYLDPDGLINQASGDAKGFDGPAVGACIVDVARKLAWPAAPNGKYTRFSWFFDFKPL